MSAGELSIWVAIWLGLVAVIWWLPLFKPYKGWRNPNRHRSTKEGRRIY